LGKRLEQLGKLLEQLGAALELLRLASKWNLLAPLVDQGPDRPTMPVDQRPRLWRGAWIDLRWAT
jgi:hypothetical protein